jgi:hypothetical protein
MVGPLCIGGRKEGGAGPPPPQDGSWTGGIKTARMPSFSRAERSAVALASLENLATRQAMLAGPIHLTR